MKQLLVLVLLCAAPSAHAQGFYLGLGVGGPADINDELGDYFDKADDESGGSGRIVLGKKLGPWAIEGVFFGTDMVGRTDGGNYSALALGIDARYNLAITSGWDVYVRAGLNKTWLTPEEDAYCDDCGWSGEGYQGRGIDYGTGIQYTLRTMRLINVSFWLDFNRQVVRLRQEGSPTLDGKLSMVTLGLSVGTGL